jgi:hypothetical protein
LFVLGVEQQLVGTHVAAGFDAESAHRVVRPRATRPRPW